MRGILFASVMMAFSWSASAQDTGPASRESSADPETIARQYLAARMIQSHVEVNPDGRSAEVRAIVGDRHCNVSLAQNTWNHWLVTALSCRQ